MSLVDIVQLLESYKYVILFPLAFFEGPTLMMIVGLLIAAHVFDPLLAFAVVLVGASLGDTFWYAIGRYGHGPFAYTMEKLFRITPERLEKARALVGNHRIKMIAAFKLSWGVSFAGLVAAGIARIPYLTFLGICVSVTIVQAAGFMMIGYFFGEAYKQVGRYVDYAAATVLAVIVLVIAYIVWKRWRKEHPPILNGEKH